MLSSDQCWVHRHKVVGSIHDDVVVNLVCPWVRYFTKITPLDPGEMGTSNAERVTGLLGRRHSEPHTMENVSFLFSRERWVS